MPRRGNVPKREVLPDPMYNSVLVTKLVNSVMLDGKKGVAQKVVYDAFDIIKEKTGKEPLDAFTEAMNNIKMCIRDSYSLVTQQPLGGKAQFGGQRFGEMEV